MPHGKEIAELYAAGWAEKLETVDRILQGLGASAKVL